MDLKYMIFTVVFLGYGIFSYNRKSVTYAAPSLVTWGLGNEQLGLILSSQNLAYAISKFFGGIISDRLSPKVLFSSGLLLSGLTALLFSIGDSVYLFTAAWFLNGLAQGVGWPAIAKLLRSWFEPGELGTWWSLASASANLVGCLAPFLASHLVLSYGWRYSLMFVGVLTGICAVVSYIFIEDEPAKSQVQRVKDKPKKAAKSSDSPKKGKDSAIKSGEAFMILLSHAYIWHIAICYLIVSLIKTTISDWGQMYLMNDLEQPALVANSFISCVEFGGFIGGILAGFLSDQYVEYVTKKHGGMPESGHPRMFVAQYCAAFTGLLLVLFNIYVDKSSSAFYINQFGLLLGACIYGQIALYGVVATQSAPAEMSGTAHAIVALAANMGSIAAGLPMASIAKHTSWAQVLLIIQYISIFLATLMFVLKGLRYRISGRYSDQKRKE